MGGCALPSPWHLCTHQVSMRPRLRTCGRPATLGADAAYEGRPLFRTRPTVSLAAARSFSAEITTRTRHTLKINKLYSNTVNFTWLKTFIFFQWHVTPHAMFSKRSRHFSLRIFFSAFHKKNFFMSSSVNNLLQYWLNVYIYHMIL